MKLIRLLCLVLVLALACTPLLAACGDNNNASSAATGEESEESGLETEFTDKTGKYKWSVSGRDWSDIGEITFLTCGVNQVQNSEIVYTVVEKESKNNYPEVINNDIGERTNQVEQILGVKVKEEYVYDAKRMNALMCERIRTGNLTATEDYQVVVPCLYDGATLAVGGELMDLRALKDQGLQIDAPWWSQEFNKTLEMGGQLYFTVGDIGLGNKNATAALYFNLDLWTRLGLTEKFGADPYQLVRDGKWTVDRVFEAVKNVGRDLNRDNVVDYSDEFGWGGQLDDMWSVFFASGARIASADPGDYPKLTMFTERSDTLMTKLQSLVQDKEHYISGNDYFGVTQWPMELIRTGFIEGRALFYNAEIGDVVEMGPMEEHFGIVPVPKADDGQEIYYSLINPWVSTCFAIPVSCNGDMLAMTIDVLNVMGAYSGNTVAKDFDEIVLSYQKTRDDETVEMIFDYIFPGRACDIGMIYKWGNLDTLLHDMAKQPAGSFASNYEARASAAQAALDETVDQMKKNAK